MATPLISLIISLFWCSHALHPIHISVTEIEYDEKDKALEIMMRVFMDDLEITMKKRHQDPNLDITRPTKLSLDQMMEEYLKSHFIMRLDEKVQRHQYLGHERDGDAFVFYIEVPKVKKWNKITVTNSVLMETYEDQSNLVHVRVAGKIKSLRLVKKNPSGILTF
jgi:hypothetical protein